MFILTKISDLVQIYPEDFQKPSVESIEDNINAKYANKVIQKIGLCICLYDILKASDGLIGHGTGIVNVNVEFRVIVFRPFKGEIILGRISSASEFGMKIALDFFDDIFVPPHLMFPGSFFNVQEQCWVWPNEGQEYFYDKHEWVRFRVEQEQWHDASPLPPSERQKIPSGELKSPYSLTKQECLARHSLPMDYYLTINGLGGTNTLEDVSLFAPVDSTSVIAGLRIAVPLIPNELLQLNTSYIQGCLWALLMLLREDDEPNGETFKPWAGELEAGNR